MSVDCKGILLSLIYLFAVMSSMVSKNTKQQTDNISLWYIFWCKQQGFVKLNILDFLTYAFLTDPV